MEQLLNEPNIYETPDFRSFLREYLVYKKNKNAKYSFTTLSQTLGLSSRSFIQDVIAGKKNLSLETIDKFKALFPRQLEKFEHFRKLVLRDQAKNTKERDYYANQISFERKKKPHDMPSLEYALYSDWFFVPIFFLACDPNFNDDVDWIAHKLQFQIPKAKIRQAIETLYKLKYWAKDPAGKTQIQLENISSHTEIDRQILKQFHGRMLEIGRQTVELPFYERILNASTILIDDQQLNELRDKIFKFKETELKSYQGYQIEPGSGKRVYQFQFAVFPLTKTLGAK